MSDKETSSRILFVDRTESKQSENFVPRHTLAFQLAGTTVLNDKHGESISRAGSLHLLPRNLLVKFNKRPSDEGVFKLVALNIDQQLLRQLSIDYDLSAGKKKRCTRAVIKLEMNDLLTGYLSSLTAYKDLNATADRQLIELKIKEGVLILLRTKPDLKNILFDFTEPGKIDLEVFMQANYHFNVRLDRFAYLTGRSLATFKRDFQKTFNTSPHQWLLEKRLQEAYVLIKKKGRSVSDVYTALGFENMSHFSYVFKRQFGKSPTQL